VKLLTGELHQQHSKNPSLAQRKIKAGKNHVGKHGFKKEYVDANFKSKTPIAITPASLGCKFLQYQESPCSDHNLKPRST